MELSLFNSLLSSILSMENDMGMGGDTTPTPEEGGGENTPQKAGDTGTTGGTMEGDDKNTGSEDGDGMSE